MAVQIKIAKETSLEEKDGVYVLKASAPDNAAQRFGLMWRALESDLRDAPQVLKLFAGNLALMKQLEWMIFDDLPPVLIK